ncbi:hypothetical protein [Elizabethkingia anophelis]|jgi:hypothetical protein|uniref:hypothetical protein n=1 Tax=Elizabethkingia anophelis TaxID=1117645 RepID=UPI0021A2B1CE|nr:hypothetical protein [Elizabethkingia anophelis]MDV4070003.1 hypothetical protein [Elizabethkingia anophelis]
MERELPIINIEGTNFIVDIENLQLREKSDENNVIPFGYMSEVSGGYEFEYGVESKNIHNIWIDEESMRVKIPELVELDPLGMSIRYNMPLDELKGKNDFEVMVDQKAFDLRVNKGMLPTIDIAGDIFYVVLDKDQFIAKDDPKSIGMQIPSFEQYDQVLGENIFAYDPKNRRIKQLDYLKIKEIPKDLIAIKLPFSFNMDPVGWNLENKRDAKFGLKTSTFKMHFNSPRIPWEKTDLPDIIKENAEDGKNRKLDRKQKAPIQQKTKKGRRI